MRPSVTVAIAVWNGAWCIERALDSVFAQSRPAAEVILCDDGSTDGTPELVERRYGARVRILRLPHRNAAAARHDGLAIATSDWLAFLDADDWWEPDKLERQFTFLDRHPEVTWACSDGRYVSEAGVVRESWLADYFVPVRERIGDLFPEMLTRCFPLMSSMLVRRDEYLAVGGIDPNLVYSHDYDLWLRLAAHGPGAVQAESLVSYWSHPNALSRRYEGRYRDDLALLEAIERGALRDDDATRRAARFRRASHAFDLGMLCLRSGRAAEGRALLRRALDAGPPLRRVLALAGTVLPGGLLPAVLRMGWLRRVVSVAREPARTVSEEAPS